MASTPPSALARLARVPIAVGAALALADASVVTLALPELLDRLDTTVTGLAAIIGVYTVVLAVAVLVAVPVRRWLGSAAVGGLGMLLFAVASVMCGVSDGLTGLLVSRALQAVGAGFGLLAAYELLARGAPGDAPDGRPRPAPLWVAAAIFGTAIGPALGGALTEVFSWRAIFLAQAPFGVLAALACLVSQPGAEERGAPRSASAGGADAGPTGTGPSAGAAGAGPRPARPAGPGAAPGRDRAWPLPAPRPARSVARPSGHDDPTRVVGPATDPTLIDPARGAAPLDAPPAGDQRLNTPPPAAGGRSAADRRSGPRLTLDGVRAGVALALVSAALTAVVFLLVLLLVTGWDVQPLKAAVGVTLLPVAAVAGWRIPGDAWVRASLGSALVGAGILALAAVPTVGAGWVVLPQLLSGVGMGMALPALAGELLPERTPGQAARLLSLRHVGITVALLALAPVISHQLDTTIDRVEQQVAALVLDAKLPPEPKLNSVGKALDDVNTDDPRGSLQTALSSQDAQFDENDEQRATYAALKDRADEALVVGVTGAFRDAFLITGALALLAALLVVPLTLRRVALVAALGAVALALAGGQALVSDKKKPAEIAIADPCKDRPSPNSGGLDGFVQDAALGLLDRAACRFGSSREELALSIGNDARSEAYLKKHGVDPRKEIPKLVTGAIGGGDGAPSGLEKLLQRIIPGL